MNITVFIGVLPYFNWFAFGQAKELPKIYKINKITFLQVKKSAFFLF